MSGLYSVTNYMLGWTLTHNLWSRLFECERQSFWSKYLYMYIDIEMGFEQYICLHHLYLRVVTLTKRRSHAPPCSCPGESLYMYSLDTGHGGRRTFELKSGYTLNNYGIYVIVTLLSSMLLFSFRDILWNINWWNCTIWGHCPLA